MAVPVDAPLAPELDLPDGYRVVFAALNPTTGAAVPGVVVEDVSIFGTILGTAATEQITLGPFMLVPGPGSTV